MSYSVMGQPEIVAVDAANQFTGHEGAAGRKSFHSVDIRDLGNGEVTLPSSGTLRSSSASSLTGQKPNEKRHSRTSSLTSLTKSTVFSKTASWTFEIISLIVAVAAVASIVGVLAHFDGRALPEWPYDITLNTLVALLATVANANLAIPLQSGLSQLKWIRFKAGRAPLADMELFDEASRGTWGAIKLLAKARGGFFGSVGAVVAVVALALGPFAQQMATYREHIVESPIGATIPRALNYSGFLPGNSSSNGFVPILPMKAAVYNGLFAENNNPTIALPRNCHTGNCTWETYDTLAVCYQCTDMSAYMSRYCADGTPSDGSYSGCGWQIPSGARLNTSSHVFSMTSQIPSFEGDMPHTTIMRLAFMGTESFSGKPGQLNPWALQCILQACVQTMHSAIINGQLSENTTGTILNRTVVDMTRSTPDGVYISTPRNETFKVSLGAMLGMRSWFQTLFVDGTASRNSAYVNQTIDNDAIVVNLTVGISSGQTFFDTDILQAFYWNFYEYSDGLERLMRDLATSMTVAFRSFNGAVDVHGLALSTESVVHVRWAFIALPLVVLVLTGLFLAAAIFRSRTSHTKLWKSSALAMLFHGLDCETRAQFGQTGSLDEKMRQAKDVRVKLDESDDDESLLTVSPHGVEQGSRSSSPA